MDHKSLCESRPTARAAGAGDWLPLYRAMATARQVDLLERDLVRQGEAFFHIHGMGHESSAALAPHLIAEDWLACHYRDKALMLMRGLPLVELFAAQLCRARSPSAGRQIPDILSYPPAHVLSLPVPVGNIALHAVGVAHTIRHDPARPIVVCAVGDGTTQQGEFLEACAEAVRSGLPVLFLVEDNGYSISTSTAGRTFFSLPHGPARELFGMPIRRVDGRRAVEAYDRFREVAGAMRHDRRPALVLMSVERLDSHTNADDQSIYRERGEIERAWKTGDPLRLLEEDLLQAGCDAAALRQIQAEVQAAVAEAAETALMGPDPVAEFAAKAPLPPSLTDRARENRGDGGEAALTMGEALREVLRFRLRQDERVVLFGEDIEDPKGDVFGVTRGLSTEFPDRVINAPLSEATIIGVSIGRALAGARPVAFLQFADFLPLAYNQIHSELASIYWRTAGGWQAPVIVMISCGGYRPGLGPFHAQSFEAVAAHTPGLDVFMPSTAADAAGMLNAAFESNRPTLFFYPKSCLYLPAEMTGRDVHRQFVPIGVSRVVRPGRDVTFVAWGNTVGLCKKAAAALAEVGAEAEILDLRSISPWDRQAVLASAEKTGRLVIVHEDNATCGMGAEIAATVAEQARAAVAIRRIARPDTFVPCNFANQLDVLPSFQSVLTAAAGLLDLELSWQPLPRREDGTLVVEAIGSGPSDETVIVTDLPVAAGDRVRRGELVALVEASKAVVEVSAPVSGVVSQVFARVGDTVAIGAPLLALSNTEASGRRKAVTQEQPGLPILTRRKGAVAADGLAREPAGMPPESGTAPRSKPSTARQRSSARQPSRAVGFAALSVVAGSRVVGNEELLAHHPDRSPEDVLKRTGIETRRWAADGEDTLSLAVGASREVLRRTRLSAADLDLIVCSTTSPPAVAPSLACRVLAELAGQEPITVPAYDLSAACSGYLYALGAAYDHLQVNPGGRVLVITTDVLSPMLDPQDFDTFFLFADAASATVVLGEERLAGAGAILSRPTLSAKGEDGTVLSVPLPSGGPLHMKGPQVFSEAVRAMEGSLARACREAGIAVGQLGLVIPHQANQRILDAISRRLGVPVYSNIRSYGNTSSTSIPLALDEILPHTKPGTKLGLCAFGGGFTFGAAILETAGPSSHGLPATGR